jgi:hypothetical protein
MGLAKKTLVDGIGEPVNVNVYVNKEIVFSGSQKDAANFMGMCYKGHNITRYIRSKKKYKKTYAIRYVKDVKES